MQPDLETLRILPSELEHLTGLDISDTFMGRVYRPSVFHHRKRLASFVLTELLTLGLILIFCLPIGVVVARGFGILSGDISSAIPFLSVTLSVAIALFILWNVWMKQRIKRLKTLAHLLDEVDQYNEIIQAVHIMDELSAIQDSTVRLVDRQAVCQALRLTRASLVSALMTERILRKHHHFVARRHELFTNIESNLVMLQTLQVNNQANEYGQLLNEALRIGMSVQEELGKSQPE
ncbi:hypothetical protein IFO70_11825 [Phormidium tenue FACHB-886]|nr:hypothetical protein [Phormidium tenue FACHB-886]